MSLDSRILSALRGAGERGLSGAELAQQLSVTHPTLWSRLEELRRLGYDIAATPHQGYQLLSVPDVLHADNLLSLVAGTRVIGRDIRVFQETDSTNDLAEKLARDGVTEGVVIFAESQRNGRGRLGRRWHSPPGKGLWFSVLLRPSLPPQAATQFTVAAATALCRTIRGQTGLQPGIKWPNDILLNGRKVAGVLTELNAELDRVKYLIIGVGVDVNLLESDFPEEIRALATSLQVETGRVIPRSTFAAALLRELDADYTRVCQGQFEALSNEWEEQCTTLGRRVSIRSGQHLLEGRAEALDEDGALLLRTDHGHLERIIGGDVTLEGGPHR